MPYAFVRQVEADGDGSAVTSIASGAFSANLTAGNLLICHVWTINTDPSTLTCTLSGAGSPTWNQETKLTNGTEALFSFYAMNIGGGTTEQITATFNNTSTYPSIYAAEYSGFKASAARLAFAQQHQATPGTSTDGVTSGLLGTLSEQPAGIIAFTVNESTDTTPSSGTGFTSLTGAFDYGLGTFGARPEHRRVTATTSVAGTFTAGSNQPHKTAAWAFSEAAGGGSPVGAGARRSLLGVG